MRKLFSDNWEFSLKPLNEIPAENDYKAVDIPHDWQIYNTDDLYSTGDGYYRKRFTLSDIAEKRLSLRFDGVYMDCIVILNGEKIYEWKYGYTPFVVPLDKAREGENEIIIRVRYQSPNTRWYSGAGIYRNVWLRETGENRIAEDGTYVVNFPDGANWRTEIDTETECSVSGCIRQTLFDADEKIVCTGTVPFRAGTHKVSQSFAVSEPHLWSVDDPYLYSLLTELVINNRTVDERHERIGYKHVRFDKDEGFFLNGNHMKLNGACMHHDLGALGSAFNRSAARRQLMILKDMGVNSVRTSHNPPSVEFMDLCDELGMLVDDEIFDMWELKKTDYDYARFFPEWHERDVRSWIRRDRNHACIIMWSIGNEIHDTHASSRGVEVTKELTRCVRIDDYKEMYPITIGSNYMRWDGAQNCAVEIDLAGYNYAEDIYDDHHAKHPDWVIYGSETASTIQSRGVYHFPASVYSTTYDDLQCSSLLNCATGWSAPNCEYNITADRNRKYSLGQYIWTGFDYIGEPTPFHTKNSYFGQIDTAGFPKDSYYAYKAEWNEKASPFVHLFPYWDFNEGQLIDLFIFSNCAKTELFVNGESKGVYVHNHKNGDSLSGRWQVPYHRGEIRAVGYDENGAKVCEQIRRSFTDPAKIVLRPDKTSLSADGEDIIYVEVSAVDCDGNPVENARNRINVEVNGPGRLVGMDNGDSSDYEQYKSNSRKLFYGKLLIMIASTTESGMIELKVDSPDLPSTTLRLDAVPSDVTEGISCGCQILPSTAGTDINVRKIEMTVSSRLMTPDSPKAVAQIRLLPENTTRKISDVIFKAVTDTGVETNLLDIEIDDDKAVLIPRGDGAYRLRAVCKNDSVAEEVISEMEMENRGFGPASFNPYSEVICASLCTNTKEFRSMMEGGILTGPETVAAFDSVDFGRIGSDEVTIGIYTYNEEQIPVDLLDRDGRLIQTLMFQAKNEWNVYKYNTFKLPGKLKGMQDIAFRFHEELRFKGFRFSSPRRAETDIPALENDGIYGDSFIVGAKMIEHIGNNVSISFKGFDLGDGVNAIDVTGRTRNKVDILHLKFGESERQIIEFERSGEIVTRRFAINPVSGKQDIQLIFLPGCDFDLETFRFVK